MNSGADEQRVLITGASGFIGTNLISHYLSQGAAILNLDLLPPRDAAQADLWRQGDITSQQDVARAFAGFGPTLVLHAAARTDLNGAHIEDYTANTQGTRIVVEVAAQTPSVKRFVNFSSLLVCRLGYQPRHDEDYWPNTRYGESKVAGERIFRDRSLPFKWTIVRPTSIWGPWFGSPYRSFFEMARKGFYVHPAGRNSRRNYGYVGNTVRQITILAAAPEANRGTFYVGDYAPIDVLDWANAISVQCGRGPVRELPAFLFSAAARIGDLMQALGMRDPPICSRRLNNLLTMAAYDLSRTQALCPDLPYTLEDGVKHTLSWLEAQGRGR